LGAAGGVADGAGAGELAALADAAGFLVERLIVTFWILVGVTERSPRVSTLESFSITSVGPHSPKMV
jgi:hypothetical protein